jgi:hypothetical protein
VVSSDDFDDMVYFMLHSGATWPSVEERQDDFWRYRREMRRRGFDGRVPPPLSTNPADMPAVSAFNTILRTSRPKTMWTGASDHAFRNLPGGARPYKP